MRALLPLLLLPFLVTSCAYEGVIVNKNSRPHPFYESLGVEEMNSIELRDSSGVVHRQMVTPDVYARYEHGQYFNDLQPPPTEVDKNVDVEPTLVPMRPVKPIAGGYGRSNAGAVASNHRPTSRIAAASSGTKKATTAARRTAVTHSSLIANAAKKQAVRAPQTVAVSEARISNPAIARRTPTAVASKNQSTGPSASKQIATTSMAHFSAEITPRGVQPVTEHAAPQTSASHHPVRTTPSLRHSKTTGGKPTASGKSAKAKSMLRQPSVETRTESDRVSEGNEGSR